MDQAPTPLLSPRQSKTDRWLLACGVVWLAVQIAPVWYPAPDSIGYLSLARSLGQHGEIRNLGSAQAYYPLGYPLLISPLFAVDREPLLLIALVQFALGVGLLSLVYFWVRAWAPQHAAWLALATIGNASFGNVYRRPLSEAAFMVALFLTVAVMRRLAVGYHARNVFLAAASLAVLVLTRPAGIMLAADFGMTTLAAARRHAVSWPRAIGVALAVGLPTVAMQAFIVKCDRERGRAEGIMSYTQQIRDPNANLAEQLLEGSRLRIQEFSRLLLPGMLLTHTRSGRWLNPNFLIFIPLFAAVLWGWRRFVREHRDPLAWMLPFYLALYVVWPFDQATRFFAPLFPLLAGCVLMLARTVPAPTLRLAGIGFCILHLGVALGCWLAVDRPLAMELQAAVPDLRRVAAAIPPEESAAVAVSEQLGLRWMWVQMLLDRRVAERQSDPQPTAVHRVILMANEAEPQDFTLDEVIEGYRIYRRQEATVRP